MKSNRLAPLILGAMIVIGALSYPFLPAQVPNHWNLAGEIDGYVSRFWGVVFLPLVAAGIWLLMLALPRIDPRRRNYAEFAETYQLFINVLLLFFAALYVVTLAAGFGWNVPVVRLIAFGTGLLFAVLGNEMGRVQPNFFVGVRTPWTLADPEVWRRTHRAAGRAMVLAGVLDVAAALVLPEAVITAVILVGALGFAAFSIIYSYWLWRQIAAGKTF